MANAPLVRQDRPHPRIFPADAPRALRYRLSPWWDPYPQGRTLHAARAGALRYGRTPSRYPERLCAPLLLYGECPITDSA